MILTALPIMLSVISIRIVRMKIKNRTLDINLIGYYYKVYSFQILRCLFTLNWDLLNESIFVYTFHLFIWFFFSFICSVWIRILNIFFFVLFERLVNFCFLCVILIDQLNRDLFWSLFRCEFLQRSKLLVYRDYMVFIRWTTTKYCVKNTKKNQKHKQLYILYPHFIIIRYVSFSLRL